MPRPTPSQGVYRAGQTTRRAILDAAAAEFSSRGLAAVSNGDIARAAQVLPSQLGYYFGTKEALFVESACREILHLARDIEEAAALTRTPLAYVEALVLGALRSPTLLFFTEAVLLVRARPDQQALLEDTFDRLHREGERAVGQNFVARGWDLRASAEREARAFWAIVIGVALEGATRAAPRAARTEQETVDLVHSLYVGPSPSTGSADGQPGRSPRG